MTQKIAIAVIHGIGQARPEFADPQHPNFLSGIAPRLQKEFSQELKDYTSSTEGELVFEPVYWADVVQQPQNELYKELGINNFSRVFGLREFVFHSLADSIAYQPTAPSDKLNIYEEVHQIFAQSLERLANRAGGNAPLCIIAHSMGAAIASNYIWDTQDNEFPSSAKNNPLERGETFSSFYTFVSQIPFWSMRFYKFGVPIQVPSPKLSMHYPKASGKWMNFFSRNDLLGYPIKDINELYKKTVLDEREVQVGNLLTRWNPLCHNEYWKSRAVTQPIASSLASLWRQINLEPS
ncbi:hypothetical protein [Nodosilinea sp. FACHB-13]|uniref:hypothetical protein n=1 Tax=Cyanophyceae TaxID=3028117 RepID=UPI001685FD09|nr:hypothetical protein [Nodosilinea sp. FACHB-13]MBD2109995.1 hypothetical protein [Nodosilinea sp. FACHB-13]